MRAIQNIAKGTKTSPPKRSMCSLPTNDERDRSVPAKRAEQWHGQCALRQPPAGITRRTPTTSTSVRNAIRSTEWNFKGRWSEKEGVKVTRYIAVGAPSNACTGASRTLINGGFARSNGALEIERRQRDIGRGHRTHEPVPRKTTTTVRSRIRRSNHRLQPSMYSRSSDIFVWNDCAARAVTCHKPLIPA